jgi:hypothetical protein
MHIPASCPDKISRFKRGTFFFPKMKILPLEFQQAKHYTVYVYFTFTVPFAAFVANKICRTRQSRASQTCLMGDMSEYVGHRRTGTFSAFGNCVQIIVIWGRALSC